MPFVHGYSVFLIRGLKKSRWIWNKTCCPRQGVRSSSSAHLALTYGQGSIKISTSFPIFNLQQNWLIFNPHEERPKKSCGFLIPNLSSWYLLSCNNSLSGPYNNCINLEFIAKLKSCVKIAFDIYAPIPISFNI